MTLTRDAMIRRKAQAAYEFAVAELARFDCPEGVNYMAWVDSPEYRANGEYRSWLYDVRSFADYRRRHPLVRLLRRSRHIGRVERGEYGEPDSRFSWRWQNLDEDRTPRAISPHIATLGLPDLTHQGRAWFDWYVRWADTRPLKIETEWSFGRAVWHSGASIGRSSGGSLTLHAAIRPLASLYVTLRHVLPRTDASRTYSLGLGPDGWVLHWDFGKPGSGNEWRRDDPLNWMRGCRFLIEDIFGRAVCTTERAGPPVQAVACFPEGQYTLTLRRETRSWKHPRWPWPYVRRSIDISLERPPGFQGKGENSYDCGPDAIYGMSSEGHSYEDAVATYVKAVLRERAKRGHLAPEHRTVLAETAWRPR